MTKKMKNRLNKLRRHQMAVRSMECPVETHEEAVELSILVGMGLCTTTDGKELKSQMVGN